MIEFSSWRKDLKRKEDFIYERIFTTTIGAWDDGSARLTAPGIAVVVVIVALRYCRSSDPPQKCREKQFSPQNSLSHSAVAIALAVVIAP